MSRIQWKNKSGETVDLHKVDEDDTLMIDGSARKVSAGTLLQKGPDNVGYFSFNEVDWEKAGFKEDAKSEEPDEDESGEDSKDDSNDKPNPTPRKSTAKKSPAKKAATK